MLPLSRFRSSVANDVFKPIYGSSVPVLEDEKLSLRILVISKTRVSSFIHSHINISVASKDQTLTLTVQVDHSVVESFAQGGRSCITSRVYPTKAIYNDARLFVFNNAKDTNVTASITVWQMNSAFIRPYSPGEDSKKSQSSVVLVPFYLFLLVSLLHLITWDVQG